MVTLVIEDTCIKVLAVKGKKVEKAATAPLEQGLVEDGVVMDRAVVGQRIRELVTASGIIERQVVVGLSGVHSIYRVVTVPRLPAKMLVEAARREFDRVMPVPLNEIYVSWQAAAMSDLETAICLVGLPRNTVDAMLETLRHAGLESRVMDIKPLALARLSDEGDAIVINVQQLSFDIVVMVKGIPQLLRSLPFARQDMTEQEKVAVIKEELDRTVAFYNSNHKDAPVSGNVAAFLSGGLKEAMEPTLGYPVRPVPEILSCPEGFDSNEYAANIGLVLKQLKAGPGQMRVNINVVPEAYLPKPRPVIQVLSWTFVLVALGVLVPLAVVTQREVRETLSLQAQVEVGQVQVRARQQSSAALEKLQAQVAEAEALAAMYRQPLADFKTQRAKVNGDLSKVTSLLPGVAEIKSIAYSGGVSIKGTAPDEATILSYYRSLRDTGRFSKALVSEMGQVDFDTWNFTLSLE